jgi:acyl carrier protein
MIGHKIKAVFAEVFQCDPAVLQPESSPATVAGWDSFGHLALVEALQNAFSVSFELEDIAQMESLGHIERILEERGARS